MKAFYLLRLLTYGCLLLLLPQCQSVTARSQAPDAGVVERIISSGRKIARDQHLEYLGYGLAPLVDDVNTSGTIWAINLVDRRQLTIDDARTEFLKVYDEYKRLTVDNPAFMAEYHNYCAGCSVEPLFSEEKIGIKLAFWDVNNDRPRPPYVAQIKVSKGTIRYFFVADETQKLGDPLVETVARARINRS